MIRWIEGCYAKQEGDIAEEENDTAEGNKELSISSRPSLIAHIKSHVHIQGDVLRVMKSYHRYR